MANEVETEGEVGSVEEKLYCYRDKDRICGPECTAWITNPPTDKGPLEYTQRHCLILSSAERTARHVTIIAATLAESEKREKVAEQDRQRLQAAGPTGGPFGTNPFPVGRKT